MSAPIFLELPVAGLTHLGYRFLNADGTFNGARVTTGITESAAADGNYTAASPTTPATAWGVYWNDSVVTSMHATQWFEFIGNVNPFSTGTGPKAITIHTEDDSAVDLGGVFVTVQDPNDVTAASGTTNGSGDLVVNLLASTQYTINTFKANYSSSPSVQTTGAGNAAQTLTTIVLTVNPTPPPPVDPTLQTVYGTLILLTGPAQNVVIKFALVPADSARPLTVNGNVVTFRTATATTDSNGFFTIDLPRTDLLDDPAFYHIVCEEAQIDIEGVALGAAALDISTL